MHKAGNVAETIVEVLTTWGVKAIFGISGDAIFPFLDALAKQQAIKYYAATHEANAALMASFYAKATGQIGVCLASSGPGTANLASGLADAYFDHAPVLAITGQVESSKLGTNAKQYFNHQLLLKPFVHSSELLVNPKATLALLQNALYAASHYGTVAHLSVPRDIFEAPCQVNSLPQVNGQTVTLGRGFATETANAASLLSNASRPLLILGSRDKALRAPVLTLSEQLGAGIILAQQSKGIIPDSHPQVLGGIGEGYVPNIISETDCILLIGTASYEVSYLPENIPLLQISRLPGNLNYGKLAAGIIGDPVQITKLLVQRVHGINKRIAWQVKIKQAKAELDKQLEDDGQNDSVPVHPARLIAALNASVPKKAIIVSDIGSFIHWFDRGFKAEEQTLLISSHWRGMGSGLPGAIGAQVGQPHKKVIALVGDGGLMLSLSELLTVVKYQLPITIIVVNNKQYVLEKHKMQTQNLIPYGYNINVPDFALLAKACSAEGMRVEEPARLQETLQKAVNLDKPVVVDVLTAEATLPLLQ